MPKENSLIDNDFIEEGDPDDTFFDEHADERAEFEDKEIPKPDGKKKDDDFELEIIDDTPEEDKGKWVADDEKDGEPDIPDDDEVKEYSEKVQSRISKLTARMHAERRAREEQERQYTEAINAARRLLNENNQLKELVEGGEKVLIDEHKGRLEGSLAAARALYREAHEAGDPDGMIKAQEAIAKAVSQLDRVSTYQPQQLQREDPNTFGAQEQPRQQPQQPQVSEQAQKWREKNPWFDTDIPMKAYALGVHTQLVEDGVQVDSPDYYSKIDSEMRQRFPERFKSEKPRREGSVVAPANRSGQGRAQRKVTLTESQVRIARRLGLTPQQMAEQILAEQENGNGREFTHTPRTR